MPERRRNMDLRFTDNSEEILRCMAEAKLRALEKCGLKAEGYAKKLAPVDTGRLRNSISHKVGNGADTEFTYTARVDGKKQEYTSHTVGGDEADAVYIGTTVRYAVNVELGTGVHFPGGRQTPWVYKDAKGEYHMTEGQRAQPFLKPAAADHADEYRSIIQKELRNA